MYLGTRYEVSTVVAFRDLYESSSQSRLNENRRQYMLKLQSSSINSKHHLVLL